MKKKKFILSRSIVFIATLGMIFYASVCTILLFPYLSDFISGKYIVETSDLPTYKEIFQSIFIVVQIVLTLLFSYFLYKTSEQQREQNYEIRNMKNASFIYYELKFCIIFIASKILYDNKEKLIDDVDNELSKIEKLDSGRLYQISDANEVKKQFSEIVHLLKKNCTEKEIMKSYMLIADLDELKAEQINSYMYLFDSEFNKINSGEAKANSLYRIYYRFLFEDDFSIFDEEYKKIFCNVFRIKEKGI